MALAPRWWVPVLLLLSAPALAGGSPEVQLCLQHLKPAEKERATKVLGSLEELPLYRVQLEVDPAKREVKGRVQVEVRAKGRTRSEVFLRVTPNAATGKAVVLSEPKVDGKPVTMERPEPTLIRLPLDPPLEPGAMATVEVMLQARVPAAKKNVGSLLGALGSSGPPGDYGAFSATSDFVSLVGIVPMMPPMNPDGTPWAGPSGIGDLALYDPSNVLGTITVPAGWDVHATGVAMGEVPEKSGMRRYSFASALVRDFPVFVSRGYQSASKTVEGVTVESFYSARNAAVGKRVLQYAASAISEFDKRLGPLPYKHFRVVEAPLSDGAGGMEFQGLITVGTSLYRGATDPNSIFEGVPGMEMLQGMMQGMAAQGGGSFGDDASPFANMAKTLERTLEFTVAHEVGHQYFAGLVGTDPIKDPVADEALTQYASVLYFEWAHGKAAAESLRQEALVSSYHLYRMSGGEDGPAHRPTETFSSSMEYGAIVYGKAPLMYHAARKLVGDDAFQRALRSYVDTYRYKWACADCFRKELAKANPSHAGALERLQDRWWEQAHGDEDLGAPTLESLMGGMGDMKIDPETQKLLEQMLGPMLGQ
ncbi:M1 family aminopeptidase [Hyalangium rubrum]|uniref:M1 family aminopeptidase n=1 Tax=Hyalangium rubrum TaxID=3103134 RepID=A0ABU5H4V3_9BACT|nr:M1 family aminopeptidase [Hyalangium sp. s54d21]MDY7228512.1 M1 family aminopeptidase [Hyalangium sp. s54d21]